MRHAICALSLVFGLATAVHARPSLTLLVQFDHQHSQESFQAMQAELRNLMKGIDLDWVLLDQMHEGASFADLVVVKFKGVCQMETTPPFLIDERGPLAFTHTADGQVLPFSEVECDKVQLTIRSAMNGNDYKHADALLGRALGRVLAHELHHVLENTRRHERDGVNRSGLTAAQLIADHFE